MYNTASIFLNEVKMLFADFFAWAVALQTYVLCAEIVLTICGKHICTVWQWQGTVLSAASSWKSGKTLFECLQEWHHISVTVPFLWSHAQSSHALQVHVEQLGPRHVKPKVLVTVHTNLKIYFVTNHLQSEHKQQYHVGDCAQKLT